MLFTLKNNNQNVTINTHWFIGFVVAYFVSQIVFKTLQFQDYPSFRITALINLLFEFLLLVSFIRIKKSYLSALLVFLICCFFIGQLVLNTSSFVFNDIGEITNGHLLQLNNYIFIILFWEVFKKADNAKLFSEKLYSILTSIFLFNSIFVLIGFFFDLEYLKSYPYTERAGALGLLNAHTFAMYFYFFVIIYLYSYRKVSRLNYYKLIYAIIISLFLGKKAVVLFLTLLALYHIYVIVKIKLKVLVSILGTGLVLVIGFRNQLINLFLELFPFWEKLYQDNGLLSILTSTRSDTLINVSGQISNNWTFFNYIIGGAVLPDYRVEFGIIDLFIFFGVIGVLIYYLIFKDILKPLDKTHKALVLIVLLTSFFVGGFLVNINLIMFYVCLITLFYNKTEYKCAESMDM